MAGSPIFPFDRPYDEVEANLDEFVETVIVSLESGFLAMPKGKGFVDYPRFESGYESLKKCTRSFTDFTPASVGAAVEQNPVSFIVVRSVLGFTPPEWAYVASKRSASSISQGYARMIDRNIRLSPEKPLKLDDKIESMITTACELLDEGAKDVGQHMIHRLDKADTKTGLPSIESAGKLGVPYAMLLYERLLGRPFASHRDSISELVGDYMESPVENILSGAGISFRKTKRVERIDGFEQAPDFIVPDEFNPKVVIEAKITEDDGTARDKATRIQHLSTLSRNRVESGQEGFQVIACIDGRGFGTRREDMKKIIRATEGRVFTLATLYRLVDGTGLADFATK